MSVKKIISILTFSILIFTAYQCGDKDAAANSAGTVANTTPANPEPAAAAVQMNNKPAPVKKSGSFVLNGDVKNAENLKVFFDQMSLTSSSQVLEKAEIDANGKFELVVSDGIEAGVYRARIGAQKAILIIGENEKNITLTGDLQTFNSFGYQAIGSEGTAEFVNNMKTLTTGGQRPTLDGVVKKIKASKNALSAGWLAHTMLGGNEMGLDAQKAALDKLTAAYPNTRMMLDMKSIVQGNEAKMKQRQAMEKIKVGEQAPDIALQSPDGKTMKLSQLKGKVVLLDFWASWCGPCRRENPNVVKTYNKYNNKGFEVFSVSLDGVNPRVKGRLTPEQLTQQEEGAKTKWKSAIQKDGLVWKYHVSDLQHWGSPVAKEYGISSIPKTFLIDRNGKIAAINPRGPALEPALKNLL